MNDAHAISRRLAEIRSRHAALPGKHTAEGVGEQIKRHLAEIQRMAPTAGLSQAGQSGKSPGAESPFAFAQVLFHLDCCETLLDHKNTNRGKLEDYLYPSLAQAISARLLSIVLRLRGRWKEVRYFPPRIREVLYVRASQSVARLVRAILPRR